MEQSRKDQEQTVRNPKAWTGAWPWPQQDEAPLAKQTSSGPGADVERKGVARETTEHDISGVYVISVAARLLHMHPQTLRKYERVGLVRPSRTLGMLRLYSEEDIAKLRLIKHLVDDLKLNLAGVELALSLLQRFTTIHRQALLNQEAQQLRGVISRELDDLYRLLEM